MLHHVLTFFTALSLLPDNAWLTSSSPLPPIQTVPAETTALRGTSAVLACPLPLGPALGGQVRWTYDGDQVSGDRRQLSVQLMSGDRYDNYGEYRCQTEYEPPGSLISPPIHLKQATPPTLDKSGESVMALAGDNIKIPCRGHTGYPTHTIRWYRNSEEITGIARYSVLPESGALQIIDVRPGTEDSNFHCRAINRHGEDNSGVVTVLPKTGVAGTSELTSLWGVDEVEAETGDSVTLECCPSHSRNVSVSWRFTPRDDSRATSPIVISSGGRLSLVGRYNLRVSQTTATDSGKYTCVIQARDAYITSTTHLLVYSAPRMSADHTPETISASVNGVVKLPCPVQSYPPSDVIWHRDSSPVQFGEFFQMKGDGSLEVSGLQMGDSGMYQCTGGNGFGYASTYYTLIVTPAAEPTVDPDLGQVGTVLAVTISARFIQLAWQKPLEGAVRARGFQVFYRTAGNPHRFKVAQSVNSENQLNVTGLTPDTEYVFKIRPTLRATVGLFSREFTFPTIAEVRKPGKVTGVSATPVSANHIAVSWSAAAEVSDREGEPVVYEILLDDTSFERSSRPTTAETSTTTYVLSNLEEWTTYSVVVRARNGHGFGDYSEPVWARTYSDVPDLPPEAIRVAADSHASLIVSWRPPPEEGRNGLVDGYMVKYRRSKDRTFQSQKVPARHPQELLLTDLEKDTTYQVSIAAVTVNGTGVFSGWASGKTLLVDLPEDEPPGKVHLSWSATATTITLKWTPPNNHNTTKIRAYLASCNPIYPLPPEQADQLDSRQFEVTFSNLLPENNYFCYVMAWNASPKMTDINKVQAKVTTQPRQPRQLPVKEPESLKLFPLAKDSISVRFMSPDASPGVHFQVRCQAVDGQEPERVVNTSQTYYCFSGLTPASEYLFDVRSVRGQVASPWSLQMQQTTEQDAPGDAPQYFSVTTSATSVVTAVLSWRPPSRPNGRITAYIVSYSQSLDGGAWAMDPVDGPVLQHAVPDLRENTLYYFKVQAKTAVGPGPWSDIKTLTTGVAFPASQSGGQHAEDEIQVGIRRQHVYIIIAAVIGASLVVICLILAFIVCHVFTNTTNKHRLIPMQYGPMISQHQQPPPQMKGPTDLWLHPSDSGQQQQQQQNSRCGSGSGGAIELKQIESDAEVDSFRAAVSLPPPGNLPPLDSKAAGAGGGYYPGGMMGSTNTGYTTMTYTPVPTSAGGALNKPLPIHPNNPNMSAFMPPPMSQPHHMGQNMPTYTQGYHEQGTLPTQVLPPTSLTLQLMQQRQQQQLTDNQPPGLYSPGGSNASATPPPRMQWGKPTSANMSRSGPPAPNSQMPLPSRQSDDASSDRMTITTNNEEDVNAATERMLELMSRVNQLSGGGGN